MKGWSKKTGRPNREGKRWGWNSYHKLCSCGTCKQCKHREAASRYYHSEKGKEQREKYKERLLNKDIDFSIS